MTDFPDICSNVDAPVAEDCMIEIWYNESCVIHGTHFPGTLTGTNRTNLNDKTVQ